MKSLLLGSAFLMILLAGCESSQSVTIYPKSMRDGTTFPSWEAAEEWMAEQTVEARKLAAELPVEYRRLAHVNRWPGFRSIHCLDTANEG